MAGFGSREDPLGSVDSGAARLRLILGEPPEAARPPSALLARLLETYGAARCLLALLLVVALAGVGGGYLAGHHRAAAGDAFASSESADSFPSLAANGDGFDSSTDPASTGSTTTSAAGDIVVDVAGKVAHPGLVTLAAGSRIADAISAAGGIRGHVAAGSVNLAAKVEDGQLIVIGGSAGTDSATGTTSTDDESTTGGTSSGPLDLNTATAAQLEASPGIGPVLAQRIQAFGQAHNGFTSVAELQQVSGIGPSHFSEIESLVTT